MFGRGARAGCSKCRSLKHAKIVTLLLPLSHLPFADFPRIMVCVWRVLLTAGTPDSFALYLSIFFGGEIHPPSMLTSAACAVGGFRIGSIEARINGMNEL